MQATVSGAVVTLRGRPGTGVTTEVVTYDDSREVAVKRAGTPVSLAVPELAPVTSTLRSPTS